MPRGEFDAWMWAEACETLARAERLHRRFFEPLRGAATDRLPVWQPPVDVLETEGEVLILVALPGVDPGAVEAAIEDGALRVAVRSVPGCEWDTGMYRSLGLDPAQAAMAFVKSPAHFRAAFGPLAARTLVADTPGGCCGNMRRVPWTRVTRPLWPLDDI